MRSFAVVPAAGRSRRMGRPKLLMPWGASTVIDQLLTAWRASRVGRVVVVVHPDDEELARHCRQSGAVVVVPPKPPPEMKDSIQCGLRLVQEKEAPTGEDVWLMAPADLPQLSPQVIDRLLDEASSSLAAGHQREILVPISGGKRGHPVLFPWPLAKEVAQLGADEGVNALLLRHSVREIDCGASGVPADLDTPEDYRRQRDG